MAMVIGSPTLGGMNLIAKQLAGKEYKFTRIALGDGELLQAQNIQELTSLINEVLSIGITSSEYKEPAQCVVRGNFSNADLEKGFFYRELGIFAQDPDTGLEILVSYGNALDKAEWIPPAGGITAIERMIESIVVVGGSENLTAVIDPLGTVKIKDLEKYLEGYYTKDESDTYLSNKVNKSGDDTLTGSYVITDESPEIVLSNGKNRKLSIICDKSSNPIGNNYILNELNGKIASLINLRSDGLTAMQGTYLRLDMSKNVHPGNDNAISLGNSSYRWKDVYAGAGTINTSDTRQKKDIETLDTKRSMKFLMELNPISFCFIDGTSGRTHYGFSAQEVEQAMSAIGLTDMDFAGLIKSPVVDENDNETGEAIYGLRYAEFIPLIIKVVQEQQKQIDALKNNLGT